MTKIKICGIKDFTDALAAVEAGADFLGFNFYPKSVRYIDGKKCAEIASVLKKGHPSIRLVGVFVNSSLDEIRELMEICTLDLAQLHGDESAQFCSALGNQAFKAFRGLPDGEIAAYARNEAPAFLLDAAVGNVYGGTGSTADWKVAAGLASDYSFLLAGGLKPENVGEAVRQVRPWGVDVASGVEAQPGRKDPARLKAFVEAVREAAG